MKSLFHRLVLTALLFLLPLTSYAGWTGSGFFITHNGYIGTAGHMVNSSNLLLITVVFNGKQYQAHIVKTDFGRDLAILKIDGIATPALRLDVKTRVGEPVFSIGFPLPQQNNYNQIASLGQIESSELFDIEWYLIETSAQACPGNSGGPLANLKGHVVGIVVSGLNLPGSGPCSKYVQAVRVNELVQLARQAGINTHSVSWYQRQFDRVLGFPAAAKHITNSVVFIYVDEVVRERR